MIKWKTVNWLFVASFFTAAYLIFIVVWIGPHKIIAFTATDQLNAIGDFLAGIFSPLAFIWLVAAVLTQRQELTDTRDQFAENQKVVDAQLKTINEQSVLLQQQHILAEETAKKTYRLSLFQERYKIYSDFVLFGEKYKNWVNPDDAYVEMIALVQRARFVFGEDLCRWLEKIEGNIHDLQQLYETPKVPIKSRFGQILCYDSKTEEDIRNLAGWLSDQFHLPAEVGSRFHSAMSISDG